MIHKALFVLLVSLASHYSDGGRSVGVAMERDSSCRRAIRDVLLRLSPPKTLSFNV